MTKDSRGARIPSKLKSSGDPRFLGRCPPVLGLVARLFLSRVSSCESKLGLWGRVRTCVSRRASGAMPRDAIAAS